MNTDMPEFQYKISVVVVCFNMQRELPRTLATLLPSYQLDIDKNDYEIIVVDNGSDEPVKIDSRFYRESNFRLIVAENPHVSPLREINKAVQTSVGENIAILIDGARMITPGFISSAIKILSYSQYNVVTALAYHLGPGAQSETVLHGYNQSVEDKLLQSIDWKSNGYELFSVSELASSSAAGMFEPLSESNSIVLSRKVWQEIEGFDEKFLSPGGGLANLDFFKRICEHAKTEIYMLIAEGSFHQFHGGVSTNTPGGRFDEFEKEYIAIKKERFHKPVKPAILYGSPPVQALKFIEQSVYRSKDIYLRKIENKSLSTHSVSNSDSSVVIVLGLLSVSNADLALSANDKYQFNLSNFIMDSNKLLLSSVEMSAFYNASLGCFWFDDNIKKLDGNVRSDKIDSVALSSYECIYDPLLNRSFKVWWPLLSGRYKKELVVLAITDPVQFSEAMASEMGLSKEQALAFWFYSYMEAEKESRGVSRICLPEDILFRMQSDNEKSLFDMVLSENKFINEIMIKQTDKNFKEGIYQELYVLLSKLLIFDKVVQHDELDRLYERYLSCETVSNVGIDVLSGVIRYKNTVIDNQYLQLEEFLVKIDRLENWSKRYKHAFSRPYTALIKSAIRVIKRKIFSVL